MSEYLKSRRPAVQQVIDEEVTRRKRVEQIATLYKIYKDGHDNGRNAIVALLDDHESYKQECEKAGKPMEQDHLLVEKLVLKDLLKKGNVYDVGNETGQQAIAWIKDDPSLVHLHEEIKLHEKKLKRKTQAQDRVSELERTRPVRKQRPLHTEAEQEHGPATHCAKVEHHERELEAARAEAEAHGDAAHGSHIGH